MINLFGVAGALIWVRNIVLIFFVLSIIYVALTFLSRMRQRDRLSSEYAKQETQSSKEEFMSQGMTKYNRSLRAKLILCVYLIPLIAFGILMFLALYE